MGNGKEDKVIIKKNGMVSLPIYLYRGESSARLLLKYKVYEEIKSIILNGIKEGKDYEIDLCNVQE